MKIYITQQNSDLIEGLGPIIRVGYFLNKEVAEYANSKIPGVFGSKNDCKLEIVDVCEARNLSEYDAFRYNIEKETALSKLTKREKQILGVEQGDGIGILHHSAEETIKQLKQLGL